MSASFFSEDLHRPETSEFLCGVVEGFYGRPWTYPQRRELFRRMQSMGMNSYLYAPKDDLKHRHAWREQYTEKEEENMRSLISAADEYNILFIFAISPGSDIIYSHDEDICLLKAKLQQATRLGCRAFALLFDDIDTRLSPADQDVFGSPGRAQVTLTNEIYNSLNQPQTFLFCPTEYCASRAIPNVAKSAYLTTLGNDLASGINVLWTGPIVVSKRIPTLGIRDLARLLKRPIVLWDNLHANDYDQRRVFLGPYSGRPLALRRRRLIQGVLTNPNCEFEANYVALHTLAQWARLAEPAYADKVPVSKDLADIGDDLERELAEGSVKVNGQLNTDKTTSNSADVPASPHEMTTCSESGDEKAPVYKPRKALINALLDWLSLMLQDQRSMMASKLVSSIPSPTPMDTDTNDTGENAMQVEPSSPMSTDQKVQTSDITLMTAKSTDVFPTLGVSLADLEFLSDLFYLPFTHGQPAIRILELGHWLRDNSHRVPPKGCASNGGDNEWGQKYAELFRIITRVSQLREKIQRLPHPGVVYDLGPYLTEINAVLTMVLDYFRWMENGVMASRTHAHLTRLLTWFSPGYSEMTMSGEHEPWVFRGGLITEIQRILPLESAQDLFPAPSRIGLSMTTTPAGAPTVDNGFLTNAVIIPLTAIPPPQRCNAPLLQPRRPYLVRPYRVEDKSQLYDLWRRLVLRRLGLSADALPAEYHDLPGDRYLLAYLEHSPQHCLVVEGPPLYFQSAMIDDTMAVPSTSGQVEIERGEQRSIVGFAFAAPDVSAWARDREQLCCSRLRSKYPKVDKPQHPAVIEMRLPMKSVVAGKPSLSVQDFISLSTEWFHNVNVTKITSVIAEAAVIDEPPEPLGASIGDQPMVIENPDSPPAQMIEEPEEDKEQDVKKEKPLADSCNPPVTSEAAPNSSSLPSASPTTAVEEQAEKPAAATVLPPTPAAPMLSQCSGGRVPVIEAIHSALMAHPANILVELDDSQFPLTTSFTPTVITSEHYPHPHPGFDPTPELVFDEVARRLFVCLLAGLKTCASQGVHVELDAINESRADLYRRFGFYPVTAASTDFITVLGRLI